MTRSQGKSRTNTHTLPPLPQFDDGDDEDDDDIVRPLPTK